MSVGINKNSIHSPAYGHFQNSRKAAHLFQEEMIERGQNGAMAALEEKEEEIRENKESENDALPEEAEHLFLLLPYP